MNKRRKGIIAKRSLRPKMEKKNPDSNVQQELQFARCRTILPDYLGRCPECGSDEWTALIEVNPYARMPMESLIKGCAHLFWMLGILGFFIFVWQMDHAELEVNLLYLYSGIATLVVCILISTALFSLSELMRRVLRIQRRLKVFHEHYNETHPVRHVWQMHRIN